jgi:hypothetical protein
MLLCDTGVVMLLCDTGVFMLLCDTGVVMLLCVRVDIILTRGKHLHDRFISLRRVLGLMKLVMFYRSVCIKPGR